jgi:exoribonuclease-2
VTSPGRGVQVEVELDQVDELTLTVSCKLLALKNGTPTRLLDDEEEEDVETESSSAAPGETGLPELPASVADMNVDAEQSGEPQA